MRVLAVCGSGQKKGNVARLMENLTDGAKDGEHETETIFLSDYKIEPCLGCWGCYRKGKCIIKDDFEALYEKFEKADYVLLGTPVFYGGVTGMMKNYLDRYFGYAMDKFPGAENYSKMTSSKGKICTEFW